MIDAIGRVHCARFPIKPSIICTVQDFLCFLEKMPGFHYDGQGHHGLLTFGHFYCNYRKLNVCTRKEGKEELMQYTVSSKRI